jgi:uracil-DNA glycosylase family 4
MPDLYPKALETCQRCPRMVEHREAVARKERMVRRDYQNHDYWGKPVPGFGDSRGRILLLGLAPGAHGSNRTGRMFTGDASGDFLYPALYRMGFANQPDATDQDDGMMLNDMWISAACRCVPPGNKPLPAELSACQHWLEHDFSQLKNLKLVLALGSIAHDAYLNLLRGKGLELKKKDYPFAHNQIHQFAAAPPLLDSYHVSFQNTNTGKLTAEMFDAVLARAKTLVDSI